VVTRRQTSEKEHNDLVAGSSWPSIPYSWKIFKALLERTCMFCAATKQTPLAYSQDFSKISWRVKTDLWCNARMKRAVGMLQLRLNYLAASFLKAFDVHFFAEDAAFAGP